MATIGIDLGTTYSVMAHLDANGQPKIIPNADGATLTPSVVAFLGNEILVGEEAKEYQQDGSANIASFFKRSMGDPYFELEFDGKSYNTIDLSTEVLRKLKRDAETYLGEAVQAAVITVPAYFNNAQREATVAAGKKAGLHVLGILNEPTAASIAYGLRVGTGEKNVLVYDLGGGTFDVTISQIGEEDIRVLATEGDHSLGGKDFDDLLAEYVCSQFIDEFGIDLFDDEGALNSLLVSVEQVKQQLTTLQRTTIDVLHDRKRGKYEITREIFEDISAHLLERAWSLVELAIENANLTVQNIDEIILVGGSTRMPMVAQFIEQRTNITPKYHLNVDEVVALGAAIQAAILQAKETNAKPRFSLGPVKKVADVMSHSLGLVAVSNDESKYINSIMIHKNKTIPATVTKTYALRTGKNRENTWDVYVTQGETDNPLACEILGKYTVRRIPYTTQQPTQLTMTFGYDANGIMQIEASEKSTNQKLDIEVDKFGHDMSWLAQSPQQHVTKKNVNVVLAIDTSGSMSGDGIKEAMKAAKEFVNKLSDDMFSVGLLAFGDKVKMLQKPSTEKQQMTKSINSLKEYVEQGIVGYGTSGTPLGYLAKYFEDSEDKNIILLLTDGLFHKAQEEINSSKKLNEMEIDIIAVGMGTADQKFLSKIASSDENALLVNATELVQSFSNIAQVVSEQYKLTNR